MKTENHDFYLYENCAGEHGNNELVFGDAGQEKILFMKKELLQFTVDRMNNVKESKDTFEIKADFDLNEHIDPDLGIWNNKFPPVKIELLFTPDINTYILERSWHINQTCRQNEDGSVYLSFTSNQLQETLYWVLHFGSSVQVLNPPELKEMVKNEIQKMWANCNK